MLLNLSKNRYNLLATQLYIKRFLSEESNQQIKQNEEFRVLNLRPVRNQTARRKYKKMDVLPPRSQQMATDQDWGAVWPGPKSFHPAVVPLPIRQGYTPKGVAPPSKIGNAELMKIPNFLHLTPPVIKKQCEALKKFCNKWPEGLETEVKWKEIFPIEVITTDYCHGLPTIRNPLSRIVTVKVPVSKLQLDKHAEDKFFRLVGDRYNPETGIFTLTTDRCPLKKQNYDYAQYLLTALFHESKTYEQWEDLKAETDMEYYDWNNNKSKESAESIVNWGNEESKLASVNEGFKKSVENLINEGENEYNLNAYKNEVKTLLGLSS